MFSRHASVSTTYHGRQSVHNAFGFPLCQSHLTIGEISSDLYRHQQRVPKSNNVILLTLFGDLRQYIVTIKEIINLKVYSIFKKKSRHFQISNVTLTLLSFGHFLSLGANSVSENASQMSHLSCQTFWYIKLENPFTNKKVMPQNVKKYRFPKRLSCQCDKKNMIGFKT